MSTWSFSRFVRESYRYTRPMPLWRFVPSVIRRWPTFNRQQKIDRSAGDPS